MLSDRAFSQMVWLLTFLWYLLIIVVYGFGLRVIFLVVIKDISSSLAPGWSRRTFMHKLKMLGGPVSLGMKIFVVSQHALHIGILMFMVTFLNGSVVYWVALRGLIAPCLLAQTKGFPSKKALWSQYRALLD